MGQKGEFQELDPAWKKKLGNIPKFHKFLGVGNAQGSKIWDKENVVDELRDSQNSMDPHDSSTQGKFGGIYGAESRKKNLGRAQSGIGSTGKVWIDPAPENPLGIVGIPEKIQGVWGNVGKGENLQNSGLWILWDHGMVGND